MIHRYLLFRDGDPEKPDKGEEDAAEAACVEASQTVPQVPITTPPPPMSDMSAHSAYGGYSSWYQVSWQTSMFTSKKCQQTSEFCVTSHSFTSSNHSTAAMVTRTLGTTTRVIILPARRDSTDCDSTNGHRKQFYKIWRDVSAPGSDAPTPSSFCPVLQLVCCLRPIWRHMSVVVLSV